MSKRNMVICMRKKQSLDFIKYKNKIKIGLKFLK